MTGESATPSGQAPSQPAATTQPGTSAAPEPKTLLGGDPAAAPATPAGAKPAEKPTPSDPKAGDPGKPAEKPADKSSTTAPEAYTFQFADGVIVDQAALQSFTPVMRELGLTQEQGQKLVDVYATQIDTQNKAFEAKLGDEKFALEQTALMLSGQRDKWAETVKSDKEIGGKHFDANVQVMQKAIGRFGSPGLKTLLETTGLGNHPELVRFCLKVGHAISEDNPNPGHTANGGRKSDESVFYGASN